MVRVQGGDRGGQGILDLEMMERQARHRDTPEPGLALDIFGPWKCGARIEHVVDGAGRGKIIPMGGRRARSCRRFRQQTIKLASFVSGNIARHDLELR